MKEKENAPGERDVKLEEIVRANFSDEDLVPRFREGNESIAEALKAEGARAMKYSAEEIESAVATVTHIKSLFEKDCSIDWQVETGLLVSKVVDNPVRYYKDLIVKELEKVILILGSLQ